MHLSNGFTRLHILLSDDDIECEPGLVCMQRNEWESVPGCDGIGEYGYDYCYDPTE